MGTCRLGAELGSLLKAMLAFLPEKRPTAARLMRHRFFDDVRQECNERIARRLRAVPEHAVRVRAQVALEGYVAAVGGKSKDKMQWTTDPSHSTVQPSLQPITAAAAAVGTVTHQNALFVAQDSDGAPGDGDVEAVEAE